jgi:phosphoribosylformylglycinamidine synthase PurS subunit
VSRQCLDRLAVPTHLEQPEKPVARVVVDVMLKPEILDPQGQAVRGALSRLGHDNISSVRQGKRFELQVDTPDAATLDQIASTLLANTVIEDYVIRVEDD